MPLFLRESLIFAAQQKKSRNKFGIKGAVAQSVEQRTENPCVGGSIPPHTTSKSPVNFDRALIFSVSHLLKISFRNTLASTFFTFVAIQ